MVGSIVNQQARLGSPLESKLIMIYQGAISHLSKITNFLRTPSPITKFKNLSFDNSMLEDDLELQARPVPALANASKWNQLPALIRRGNSIC